jgi:release factor glutamine methyltransferase
VERAGERFLRAGIAKREARLDAEVLARHVLGWDRARFLSDRRHKASAPFEQEYEHVVARREKREPLPYITGLREFWGTEFEICSDVLIPRPETETIIEEALDTFGRDPGPLTVVDAGTGSGCLAVTLAMEWPQVRVIATDISPAALTVARRNATRLGVSHRITFVGTSFLRGLGVTPDLIVSNPPYVPAPSAPALPPEVRDYEPRVALTSGPDGLDAFRELLEDAETRLPPSGWLIAEFGDGQEDDVRSLIAGRPGFSLVKIRDDLQGIARTAVVRKIPKHI